MKLAEGSREITAFTTPRGLFQWKVLPMGIKTSGAVFQRLMDTMLGELQPRCVVVYIDDITIFSPSLCQHLIDLGEVFKRITAVNLKLDLEKCIFLKTEVKVLGHLVLKQGIQLDQRRLKVFRNKKLQRMLPE